MQIIEFTEDSLRFLESVPEVSAKLKMILG